MLRRIDTTRIIEWTKACMSSVHQLYVQEIQMSMFRNKLDDDFEMRMCRDTAYKMLRCTPSTVTLLRVRIPMSSKRSLLVPILPMVDFWCEVPYLSTVN